MNLADNLKKIRKDRNLSQEQLAEKLGVSRQSVSKWESGVSYPEMDKVLQICQLFNLNINELINEDIKEVNEKKESQIKSNKYITSFFNYLTKVVDMFSSMKWKEKIKCLIEQCVIAFIICIVLAMIGMVGSAFLHSLLNLLPDTINFMLYHLFETLYLVLAFIVGVVILLHIFKVRYLDYYEIVKEEVSVNEADEEIIKVETKNTENNLDKSNKIILEKKKEKVIIRDPKHSEYKFLSGLGKIALWFIKLIVVFILFGFIFSLIAFVLCLPICFLIFKSGLLFIGLLLGILGCVGMNIIILEMLYNFIFNRHLKKARTFIVGVVSIILIGLGIGVSCLSFNSFEYKEEVVPTVKDVYTVDMKDSLYFNFSNVTYIEKNIENVEIEVEHSKYYDISFYEYGDDVEYWLNTNFSETMNLIKVIINDLNNRKVVSYIYEDNNVIIYANKENIKKLQANKLKRENEIENYRKNMEEKENQYEELSEEYDDLKEVLVNSDFEIVFDNENRIIDINCLKEHMVGE